MSVQNKQQGFIKQMKVSTMLNRILSESLLIAKDFHHEFFTPEHVLATAIKDEFVEQLLANSGSDTKELRSNVADFLATKVPVISKDANPEILKSPVESAGFQAVMSRAVFHCISSEQDTIDITDILMSMIYESKNY